MYLNVRIAVEALEPIQLFFRGFPQKSRVLPPPRAKDICQPKGSEKTLLFIILYFCTTLGDKQRSIHGCIYFQ